MGLGPIVAECTQYGCNNITSTSIVIIAIRLQRHHHPTNWLSDRLAIRPSGSPTDWQSEQLAIRPTG